MCCFRRVDAQSRASLASRTRTLQTQEVEMRPLASERDRSHAKQQETQEDIQRLQEGIQGLTAETKAQKEEIQMRNALVAQQEERILRLNAELQEARKTLQNVDPV